jgi:hypothetical protein
MMASWMARIVLGILLPVKFEMPVRLKPRILLFGHIGWYYTFMWAVR